MLTAKSEFRSPDHVFQIHCIKAEIHFRRIYLRRPARKINHACKRMKVLLVVKRIVLAHGVNPQNVIHVPGDLLMQIYR